MVIIDNVGSLNYINQRLGRRFLPQFEDVESLEDFWKDEFGQENKILRRHRYHLEFELSELKIRLPQNELERNSLNILKERSASKMGTIKWLFLKIKLSWKIYRIDRKILRDKNRKNDLENSFDRALAKSSKKEISSVKGIRRVLNENHTFVLGTIGEQKLVEALNSLSDEFTLINDVNLEFQKSLYRRKYKDYIKTVQIDHVLVAPSGVFVIETKNWSRQNWQSSHGSSPYYQLERANYAMYRWLGMGKRVPIRGLLVSTGYKPTFKMDFIKVLHPLEIASYVNYFGPVLNHRETQRLVSRFTNKGFWNWVSGW